MVDRTDRIELPKLLAALKQVWQALVRSAARPMGGDNRGFASTPEFLQGP